VGPQPFEYQFFVLNSPEINAFAVPGGKVFLNSGLILVVETEDEMAGVIAHEIGHVAARHISKRSEKSMPLSLATLGAILLGIFLGPKAATAVATATMAASETVMLKYSRDDEDEADYLGLKYMDTSGYDRKAMGSMFKKLRRAYGPSSSDPPAYLMTHPAAEERADKLAIQMSHLPSNPKISDSTGNMKRIQTKLRIEEKDAPRIVAYFENWLKRQPNEGEAYFGLALALRRMGALDRAIENLNTAISFSPEDGEMFRELGNTHFLKGNSRSPEIPGRSSGFPQDGITLLSGTRLFRAKILPISLLAFLRARDLLPEYPEVYYHLGRAYGGVGQLAPPIIILATTIRLEISGSPSATFKKR
jgi:predicted Zn-dependent protease